MSNDLINAPILIVGAGSIGQRHLENLHTLGARHLSLCDIDPARLTRATESVDARTYHDLDIALSTEQPICVFVCTPPSMHVSQACAALDIGAHVFIEKPIAHQLAGLDNITEWAGQRVVQVGYNLRFHPGIRLLKRLLDEGEVGKPLWMHAEVGQFLPDWRPWQDYRQSYSARRDLGGGIILDASHEIDYVLWLLGMAEEVACMAGHVSSLEVEVEDCATILLRLSSGAQADIHLDFVQRAYSRSCRIAGSDGTIEWNYTENKVRLFKSDLGAWTEFLYTFVPNQMYFDEVQHFLDTITQNRQPLVGVREGCKTLEVALAAKEAARRKMWISIPVDQN